MTNFWTNPNVEPKRGFKFVVTMTGGPTNPIEDGASWYASKADKPRFTIQNTQHRYINHTFNYPGRLEWETVSITLVDPATPDAAANIMGILKAAGYNIPANATDFSTIISKKEAVGALGTITVEQIGDTRNDVLETWTLNNAWVEAINFSSLDYETEELSTIEMTIRYDWASFKNNQGATYFQQGTQD